MIKPPEEYPGKRYRKGYCYEHHYVYWKHTGKLVPEGFNLHHRDENPHNNVFDNLELIKLKTHVANHKRIDAIIVLCENCQREIKIKPAQFRYKEKKGMRHFCSRRCIGKKIGGSRLSEDRKIIIKKEHDAGKTGYAIAKKYGWSKEIVYFHLRKIRGV